MGEADSDCNSDSEGEGRKPRDRNGILATFKRNDPNGDGCFSVAQLSKVLSALGLPERELQDMVRAANHQWPDGEAPFDDLIGWLFDGKARGSDAEGGAAAMREAAARAASAHPIGKVHSAVRWNKLQVDIRAAIEEACMTLEEAVATEDPANGNRCLHIASQNGHRTLVKWLLASGSEVNAQNFKGQTALHMSVAYDMYFVSLDLIEAGADKNLENAEEHPAITGIDGDKVDKDAWDHPVNILKAAVTEEEIEWAMKMLENADPETLDKAELARTGMARRKTAAKTGSAWNAVRFLALMKKV